MQFPGLQVRVRGEPHRHNLALEKANTILSALTGLGSEDFSAVRWVVPTGSANFIGYDTQRRPEFTVNFEVATN